MIFCAAGGIGLSGAMELRRRPRLLHSLADALSLLRSDIVCRLLPLPEALHHVAEASPGETGQCFFSLAGKIGETEASFSALWHEAVGGLNLPQSEATAALLALGEQLGRYDAEAQARAIDACIAALHTAEDAARQSAAQKGKLYSGLGFMR